MSPEVSPVSAGFKVLALDDMLYGPVDLASIQDWIRDERVNADTWIHCVATRKWFPASEHPDLRPLLGLDPVDDAEGVNPALRASVLRRVRALADLSDEHLRRVASVGEVVKAPAHSMIMRVGTIGDGVYFVLDGQVRLRIMVRGKEILISIQEIGGVFGQISLFDSGPRITDAVAEVDSTLMRIPVINFKRLCREHPDTATPMLLALGRTLATRIRSDDKHLCEMVALNQTH
jgi:hypothetical protein